MKSVLLSIKPYYVFLIIARKMGWDIPQEKTIEVRKDFPKDIEWNKVVHIYCSKDKKSFNLIPAQYQPLMRKFVGRVIGEFICDWITEISPHCDIGDYVNQYIHGYPAILGENDCLSFNDMKAYLGDKKGYDWHISDLKIYDKPKPLTSFYKTCRIEWKNCPCCEFYSTYTGCCMNCVISPPQSWFYVEGLVE